MSVGKVWLVGAGPGDPDLISVRGRELLRSADVVLHDALSHPGLLEYCEAAEIIDVGKRFGERSQTQELITQKLIELAHAGKRVVRLKGGDPYMFARGAEEVLSLVNEGIPFEIVPGVSSPVAASAFAGFPLTHRDLSSSVTFITGSDRAGQKWSPEAWRKLATATDTICIFMGMRRLAELTRAIVEGGRSPETPAAVVQWGARPEQRVVVGTLGNIAERAKAEKLTNPAIVFVGEVVRLRERLRFYDSNPLFGKRVLVLRAEHQAKETLDLLRRAGAKPTLAPLIQIDDPPDAGALERAVQSMARFDWVVFTSANGVERFFAAVRRAGRDARTFGEAQIAAIGPKTASALERHGIRPDLVATEHTGLALAGAMKSQASLGRVLLVRALSGHEDLPRALAGAGADLEIVAAYATRGVRADSTRDWAVLLENGEMDAVLFTSSSTATQWAEVLGERARTLSAKVCVASIGPKTTATLEELGIKVDVGASEHTLEGLLSALGEHLARER